VAGDDKWYDWDWYQELCEAAAAGNQLSTLQWLCTEAEGIEGVIDDELWTMGGVGAAAATCTDLTMLQWICAQHGEHWDEEQVLRIAGPALIPVGAAKAVTTQALDWLRAHYAQHNLISEEVAYAAVEVGAVASLQWLAAAGFAYTNERLVDCAVRSCQYDALRYLIEVAGCPWNRDRVRRSAAATASGDVLEWLQQADGERWSTAILRLLLSIAALADNLEAVQCFRAQGAAWPLSFLVPSSAQLEQCFMVGLCTMQWALASGCPWGAWSSSTCVAMCSQASTLSSQARQDAITWAHAAGCPCDSTLHYLAAWLQHGKKTVRDVHMPERRRWHAPLFKLCYTRTGARAASVVKWLGVVIVLIAVVYMSFFSHKIWQQNQLRQPAQHVYSNWS
jgi:hypothetical protein